MGSGRLQGSDSLSSPQASSHAKTLVVDGEWSAIGSMNFDNRSMALDDEPTLMVLDRGMGAQMIRLFLDDLQHATEITAAEFRRRPWRHRSG